MHINCMAIIWPIGSWNCHWISSEMLNQNKWIGGKHAAKAIKNLSIYKLWVVYLQTVANIIELTFWSSPMVWSLEVHSTHRPARHGKVWSPLSESRQWLCNQDHRSEISGMIRFQVREFFVLKLAGLSMKWLSTYTRLEQTLFCWLQSQVCRTNLGYGTWVPLKLDSSCHMSHMSRSKGSTNNATKGLQHL